MNLGHIFLNSNKMEKEDDVNIKLNIYVCGKKKVLKIFYFYIIPSEKKSHENLEFI